MEGSTLKNPFFSLPQARHASLVHYDSRQYTKADISNLPDSTEVPIVAIYASTDDVAVILYPLHPLIASVSQIRKLCYLVAF